MNKFFLGGVALTLFSSVAMAQDMNSLFPELEEQFKQPAVPEKTEPAAPKKTQSETEVMDLNVVGKEENAKPAPVTKPDSEKKPEKSTTESSSKAPEEEEKENEKVEGNLTIEIQNVNGVLAYARTLSYCMAEAVLTNETNQKLDALFLTITYKDMPSDLVYSRVPKKKKRAQKFMLIGLPCEGIMGMPKYEIKACKLGKLSKKECEKLVQVIPPQG